MMFMKYARKYLKVKLKDDAEDILEKKLVAIDYEKGKGKFELRDVYNGFGWNSEDDTDLANEFYYRYKFNFFTALSVLSSRLMRLIRSHLFPRMYTTLFFRRQLQKKRKVRKKRRKRRKRVSSAQERRCPDEGKI